MPSKKLCDSAGFCSSYDFQGLVKVSACSVTPQQPYTKVVKNQRGRVVWICICIQSSLEESFVPPPPVRLLVELKNGCT